MHRQLLHIYTHNAWASTELLASVGNMLRLSNVKVLVKELFSYCCHEHVLLEATMACWGKHEL
jgi:hypothetical protein